MYTVGSLCDSFPMDRLPHVDEWPTYTYRQVDRLLDLSGGTAKRWINGYSRNRKKYPPSSGQSP
jgi:hypothetical protein